MKLLNPLRRSVPSRIARRAFWRHDDRVTVRAILSIVLALRLCASSADAQTDSDHRQGNRLGDRAAISALIGSLVNKNKKPTMVAVSTSLAPGENPLFDDDYDWNEDARVRRVIADLSRFDRDELWHSLIEHIDDEQYSLAFAFNDGARIASVGQLCWRSMANDLEMPYFDVSPGIDRGHALFQLLSLKTKENLKKWEHDHADVPLYKQQIEMCEGALNRIQTVKTATPIPESEKSQFSVDVKKLIDTLRKTKKPIFSRSPLLQIDTDFYNDKLAKEIRDRYLQEKNKQAMPTPR